MDITALPEEIFIIILRKLDSSTVYNLYNTCSYIRNIICMYGAIRKFNMSLNTLSTARSLKLQFFKDMLGLHELNMCGVPDLYKVSLLPALKRLKCLKILNVGYTNITMLDLHELYLVCPTIKDITINFHFYKHGIAKSLTQDVLENCQSLFKHFENVHFIGSPFNLLHSGLAHHILKEAVLNNLTYSLAERDINRFPTLVDKPPLQCNYFSVYLLNWKEPEMYFEMRMSAFDFKNFEFVVIMVLNCDTYTVYASSLFKSFFVNNFGIEPKETNFSAILNGNVILLAWNKETVQFNDSFFLSLLLRLQEYFPSNYPSYSSDKPLKMLKNDWYYMIPKQEDMEDRQFGDYMHDFKRRRVTLQSCFLHYDEVLKDHNKVQLTIHFIDFIRNPVSLLPSMNYLKKLTYLSLKGSIRYCGEFFNILFRCCENLVTLNVEAPPISPCTLAIIKSIHLGQHLKHLRIIDKNIDFVTLFAYLSLCKTLENVHIHDLSNVYNKLAEPNLLFEKCDNLYNLFIKGTISDTTRTKHLLMFNKVKLKCARHHLHVEICTRTNVSTYNYDPFISVFKLKPIKQ